MTISKRILDRHNASIDFTSTPGVGTTFFVTFDAFEQISVPEEKAAS
jgi:signal transduction histidine kinase